MKRSFKKFETRLIQTGLLEKIVKRSRTHHVSLEDLYGGPRVASVMVARRAVYGWLLKSGKSVNEVARLFDRAPTGIIRLTMKGKT